MNIVELFRNLNEQGKSDLTIAQDTNLSQPTINRWRRFPEKIKKAQKASLKQFANAYNYQLKFEDNEPQFISITEPPIDKILPPDKIINLETVVKEHSSALGYDPTPEGLNQFLRECRGQYQTLHTIRELLSGEENNQRPDALRK